MRKEYRKILTAVLTGLLCFSAVSCAGFQVEETDDTLVYMNYGTGLQENGEYNDVLARLN